MVDNNGLHSDSDLDMSAAMAAAELAEAEAAEAEALAAAVRARARAIRLRFEARAQARRAQPPHPERSASHPTALTTDPRDADPAQEAADTEAVADRGAAVGAGATSQPRALLSEPAARPRRVRRSRASAVIKAVAMIVICGFLGISGHMMWHHHTAVERRQRAAAFIAAARQGVINMTSFDFARAKQDVQRVLDGSTGEFRDDFQKRADDFTAVVERSHTVTEGTVNSAAIESMSGDSAVVLVSATSHFTNSAAAEEKPRAWRLKVTVTRDGDQIKMSKLVFVL
jgi:Mce-associated membrane protein